MATLGTNIVMVPQISHARLKAKVRYSRSMHDVMMMQSLHDTMSMPAQMVKLV